MSSLASVNQYFSSGLQNEENYFQWRIENFELVAAHEDLINSQSFDLGINSDSTLKWNVSLKSLKDNEESWIGICFTRNASDTLSDQNVFPRFRVIIRTKDPDGIIHEDSDEIAAENRSANSCVFSKVIDQSEIAGLALIDNWLKIEILVSLYTLLEPSVSVGNSNYEFYTAQGHVKLAADLRRELDNNIEHPSAVYSDDVFILPKGLNGKGFLVSKSILAVRSAKLRQLLAENQDQEIIEIADMSPYGCRNLISYLNTGSLESDGFTTTDNAIELASIAHKFDLKELHSFCDATFAENYMMANASKLLKSALEFQLDQAAGQIMKYIRIHADVTREQRGFEEDDRIHVSFARCTKDQIITTGMLKEVSQLTWSIEHFDVLKKHDEFVKEQTIEHQAGFSFDDGAKWRISLKYREYTNDDKRSYVYITIEYELTSQLPPNAEAIYSRLEGSGNGNKIHFVTKPLPLSKIGSLRYKLCKTDQKLASEEKCLLLDLRIEIYSGIHTEPRTGSGFAHHDFYNESMEQLIKDMDQLYKFKTSYNDVTLKTKDGIELHAHWRILASRSSVFKFMFSSNLTEKQSGIIQLKDISSATMNRVLCYLYTGKLKFEKLTEPEEISEFIYAADKYNLTELLEYWDSNLACHCDMTNARELLLTANKFRLSKAKAMIFEFVKRNAECSLEWADLFLVLCECLS